MKNKNTNFTNTEYAKAYIVPQKYENLLSITAAYRVGTIFQDLCSPYEETEQAKKK